MYYRDIAAQMQHDTANWGLRDAIISATLDHGMLDVTKALNHLFEMGDVTASEHELGASVILAYAR